MTSTTLSDGRIKHEISGWTGYQNPNESMAKPKLDQSGDIVNKINEIVKFVKKEINNKKENKIK